MKDFKETKLPHGLDWREFYRVHARGQSMSSSQVIPACGKNPHKIDVYFMLCVLIIVILPVCLSASLSVIFGVVIFCVHVQSMYWVCDGQQ